MVYAKMNADESAAIKKRLTSLYGASPKDNWDSTIWWLQRGVTAVIVRRSEKTYFKLMPPEHPILECYEEL